MRGGKKHKRVFCEGITRRGTRCYAKGFPTAKGKLLCRFHGSQNVDKFKKGNYTLESRVRQLKGLAQFTTKTDEEIKKYIKQEVLTRGDREPSRYSRKHAFKRKNPFGNLRRKGEGLGDELDRFLQVMQKRSENRKKSNGS